MRIVDPGHEFTLDVIDSGGTYGLPLVFVKRIGEMYPGNVAPPHPGTNCQEVLRAVYSRLWYLDRQIPSLWTRLAAQFVGWSIWCLEARAARRHGRSIPGWRDAIYGSTCWKCGHVGCSQHCMISREVLERWGV